MLLLLLKEKKRNKRKIIKENKEVEKF